MKETELREAAICSHCQRKIGESSVPLFYRVEISRHLVKLGAVTRQMGLTAFLGGSAQLAAVMGPDEEMTENLMKESTPITICETCSVKNICVAQLAEYASR